jgi:hypothetical protein
MTHAEAGVKWTTIARFSAATRALTGIGARATSRESTMTQLDRGQSTELQQDKLEEGVIEYEGQILEQMRFVEDTLNKFAIQNYAASGAVMLAYFTGKIAHFWTVAVIVALLNACFATAIFIQIVRIQKLFVMHSIVRTHWLGTHPGLSHKLTENRVAREVLETNTLPAAVLYVLFIAQFIPLVGLLIFLP